LGDLKVTVKPPETAIFHKLKIAILTTCVFLHLSEFLQLNIISTRITQLRLM